MSFGYDENSVYRQLGDGRVLRIETRMYNTLLTLSSSRQTLVWDHGW